MDLNQNYKTGHVKPWWTDEYKNLEFIQKPFNNEEDLKSWKEKGYILKECIGWNYIVKDDEWARPFFTLFNGNNTGVTIFKMNTADILPLHRDTYKFYKSKYNINDETIYRAIVFLEDWKSGHLLEVENELQHNWKAGDYVLWKNDAIHMAANLGLESRYTAQITFTYEN